MLTPIQLVVLAIVALSIVASIICVTACMLSSKISQNEERKR